MDKERHALLAVLLIVRFVMPEMLSLRPSHLGLHVGESIVVLHVLPCLLVFAHRKGACCGTACLFHPFHHGRHCLHHSHLQMQVSETGHLQLQKDGRAHDPGNDLDDPDLVQDVHLPLIESVDFFQIFQHAQGMMGMG